ncbi:MAG: TIM barrel protein [Bacteroidales bacterium]|nr:TIM barrel protein [Bacteroidales bacterium]
MEYNELAEALAETGAEGIDLLVRQGGHVLPEKVETDLPKAVEAARKKGLEVDMIVTSIKGIDEPYAKQIIKTASLLGINHYRMGYYQYDVALGVLGTLKKLQNKVRQVEEYNAKFNIHGSYQNHHGGMVGGSIWDLHLLIQKCDPRYLGCQYDIRHAVAEGGSSWKADLELIAPWIKCIVIKDFVWQLKSNGWYPTSVPLGDGMVDFEAYFQLLQKFNISGPITVHFEYQPFDNFNKNDFIMGKETYLVPMKKDLGKLNKILTV